MILRRVAVVIWLMFGAMAQGAYPSIYAGIGDGVYRTAEGYAALMELEDFKSEHAELRAYREKAAQLKKRGRLLDKEADKEQSRAYITALRILAKEKKALNRTVLQKIEALKKQKVHATLERLMKNPDPAIAKAAYVKHMPMPEPLNKRKPVGKAGEDLRRSLMELKGKLLSARSENSPDVQCLNDITAINYWMVEADSFKEGREWCRAHDACAQVINFERAAARSCSEENPLYGIWRERSEKYRIEYKQRYAKACR